MVNSGPEFTHSFRLSNRLTEEPVNRKKSLRAAAESTHTAAKRRDAADRAVSAISDYAETFSPYLTEAQERITPLAKHAQDAIQPLAKQAQDKLEPLAKQAQDKLQPLAKQGSALAHDAYDAAAPVVSDALDKVGPVVDSAREKVQKDLLPRLHDALDSAADTPLAKEVTAKGKKAKKKNAKAIKKAKKQADSRIEDGKKAIRGSVDDASKSARKAVEKATGKQAQKKSRATKTLTGIALVSAIAAIAYVAFKKFFTDPAQSDPWKAYEPASPFAKPEPAANPAEETSDFPEEPATESLDQSDPVDEPAVTDAVSPTEGESGEVTEEIPAVDGGAQKESAGAGSYVGEDPPEGFTIKGNERSMKYHTPTSGGYDRTIAEVWFSSEEAAEKAGFTKAQR